MSTKKGQQGHADEEGSEEMIEESLEAVSPASASKKEFNRIKKELAPALVTDEEGKTSFHLYDEDNPRSLINIVPDVVKEAMLRLPRHVFDMPEHKLYVSAGKQQVHSVLRLSFWKEYDAAQAELRKMVLTNIVGRFCDFVTFYKYIRQAYFLAYMLKPPLSYVVMTEEALIHGVGRLREILDMPIVDEKGRPQTRVIDSIIRAVAFLDLRVKGGITQRHEVKQLNINMGIEGKELERDNHELSVAEIDKKIAMLRYRQEEISRGALPTFEVKHKEHIPPGADPMPPPVGPRKLKQELREMIKIKGALPDVLDPDKADE